MGNTVLLLWRTQVISSGTQWARRAFLRVKQSSDSGILFFTVAEKQCDISTPPEVRKEIADLLKSYADRLTAAAITFEAGGFKATMVRSIITAIYMASRTRFPNSVFSDAQLAAAWMSSHARGTISAAQIVRGIDTLRAV